MKYKIPVIAYYCDGQDGSGTYSVYNDMEALASDQGFDDAMIEEIIAGDDPYTNGEIINEDIEIEVVDGKARLIGKLTFHWGQ